jgi:outer membrane protein assembly factor BamB
VRSWFPLFILVCLSSSSLYAADQPQWGERYTRNMVSDEKGLPVAFNLATGEHILWTASLGGGCYSSPIVAKGKVFVGTSNVEPLDPRHKGDRGVLLCLNEKDGTLCWQLVVPRIGGDDYLDWPNVGLCSEPTIEGDRVYTVTNRSEVVCLDIHGFANGNDGPFVDEGRHMSPADEPAMEPGPLDADIVWLFDMRTGAGMYPHDSPHASILIDGDYLYLNSCNGVDNTHAKVRKPDAPCLIALDKKTGRMVARDGEGIGPRVFHCTWSPPSLADVNGQRLVVFGGPDGICYAFKPLPPQMPETVQQFERIWRFDCDPTAPKEDVHRYSKNTKEGPSEILGMPVFHKNRIYVAAGGDVWWGKKQAWLKCIDAAKGSEIWSYEMKSHCFSTPAIANDLVFIPDDSGVVHCIDAETGQPYWTHNMGKGMWGSPLVADGKVYIGAHNGAFAVLDVGKSENVLFATKFDDEINASCTAANGVLYIPTLSKLYAIK